jgi:hypothetical protein
MGVMEVAEVPVYAYLNEIFIKNFRLKVTVSITLESKSSGIPAVFRIRIRFLRIRIPDPDSCLDKIE